MNKIGVLQLIVVAMKMLEVMCLCVHLKMIHAVEGCRRRHVRVGLLERGGKTWSGMIGDAREGIRRQLLHTVARGLRLFSGCFFFEFYFFDDFLFYEGRRFSFRLVVAHFF